MKKVKCYGRQKVTEVKCEKSFIRDFFDGKKSSNSLFDHSAENDKFKEKILFPEDKENINTNILDSPTFFQNSYHEQSKKSLLFEESKVNQKKGQKNKVVTYKKKYAKVKRNRRKLKEISCKDPKLYNFAQPRWTEFYQHPFTVEHLGSKRFLNASKHAMPGENPNCSSDVQNVEKNKSNSCSKSTTSSNFPVTRSKVRKQTLHTLDASHTDELNSSGELFTESTSFKMKRTDKNISSKISIDKDIRHLSASSDNRRTLRSSKVILKDNSISVFGNENTKTNKRRLCNLSIETNVYESSMNKITNSALAGFSICHNNEIDSSGEFFTAVQSLKGKGNKKGIPLQLTISTDNQIVLDDVNFNKSEHFAKENHEYLNMNQISHLTSSYDHSRSLFSISSPSQGSFMLSTNQNKEDTEIYQYEKENMSRLEIITTDGPDTHEHSNLEREKTHISSQSMLSANQNKEDFGECQNVIENISKPEILTTDGSDTYQCSVAEKRKFSISPKSGKVPPAKWNEEDASNYVNKNENLSKSGMFITDGLYTHQFSNLERKELTEKIITSTPVVNRIIGLDFMIPSYAPSPCKRKTPDFSSYSASNYVKTFDKSIDKSSSRSLRREISSCINSALNNSLIKEYRLSLLLDNVSMLSQGSRKSFTVQNNVHQLSKTKRSSSLRNKSKSCYDSSVQNSDECDELTKENLLQLCNQATVIPFAVSYEWSGLKIVKIGEGTYGEVFTITKGKSSSVLKIIPVSQGTDDESYQGLKNVLSEVKISKCLSDLRNNKNNQSKNFIKLNRVSLVSGLYPSVLIKAWNTYSEAKSSYNIRPDIFDDKQLYAILDLEYGGKDMTSFVLRNAVEAESVLKQITVALAVAEEEFLFEHRDLHLGNILVQRSRRKNVTFKLRGHDITFQCHGLHVTIIDFTLSRLYEDGYIYYNDLANDISLFNQSGDFQFDIYRFMKQKLENKWHEASLYSNVLWLNFLCVKFKEYEYSRPSTLAHKKGLKAIDIFKNQLTHCDSALDCVRNCGISTVCFESDPNRALRLSKNSILISRNSMQKSKSQLSN